MSDTAFHWQGLREEGWDHGVHRGAMLGKCEVGGLAFPRELGAESFNSRRQTKREELKREAGPWWGSSSLCNTVSELSTWSPCIFQVSYLRSSVQFISVAQSCLTICNPINRSTPGLLVHHQLPQFTQTHIHWVSDAIQPSHPLSSPSPPMFNLSQHQGLFKWVSSLHQVTKVL